MGGFLNHVLKGQAALPSLAGGKSSTNPGGFSPGFPYFHSAKGYIPFPVTTHSLTPGQGGSFLLRSQPVLLCGLPGSGHLGTAADQACCNSPWISPDNGLVFSLAPGEEDGSHSAQASHQVYCLGPSTETGWWLSVGGYLTTITSSSPPTA